MSNKNEEIPVAAGKNERNSARASARVSARASTRASGQSDAAAAAPEDAQPNDAEKCPIPECTIPRPDHNSLTVRQYFDRTVTPILLHGLEALAHDRPEDPVTYLAAYLLKNKHRIHEVCDNAT